MLKLLTQHVPWDFCHLYAYVYLIIQLPPFSMWHCRKEHGSHFQSVYNIKWQIDLERKNDLYICIAFEFNSLLCWSFSSISKLKRVRECYTHIIYHIYIRNKVKRKKKVCARNHEYKCVCMLHRLLFRFCF